jgi:hypothetical protein
MANTYVKEHYSISKHIFETIPDVPAIGTSNTDLIVAASINITKTGNEKKPIEYSMTTKKCGMTAYDAARELIAAGLVILDREYGEAESEEKYKVAEQAIAAALYRIFPKTIGDIILEKEQNADQI